jgi:hypothetical protein
MKPDFSAGAPFLGYLYQAQYALYALLRERRPEAKLVIEGLDDVVIEHNKEVTLMQLKHQLKVRGQANLTASSPALWHTLYIWAVRLKNGEWQPGDTKLALITTAKAPDNSLPALLREGKGRNETEAIQLLLKAAAESKSKDENRQLEIQTFIGLTPAQRADLISAVAVCDSSPHIQDLPKLIRKELCYSVLPEHEEAFYERLQSWWFDKVVEHLAAKSHQQISWPDLQIRIADLVSRFQRDSLPLDYTAGVLNMTYFEAQQSRMFVRQLHSLKVSLERVQIAVDDYYRAFEQRTKWVKDKLIIDYDLGEYEAKLKREWYICVTQLKDNLDDVDELEQEAACVKFGKRVLTWMENAKIPIRKNMPLGDDYVMRGSYHMLADLDTPAVYWHPKFLTQLQEAVAEVTA